MHVTRFVKSNFKESISIVQFHYSKSNEQRVVENQINTITNILIYYFCFKCRGQQKAQRFIKFFFARIL